MLYHDIENNEIVTREQLLNEYTERVRQGDVDANEVQPYQFIENCMARYNGTLETVDEYYARMDNGFDDFLCERADEIDSAALRLLSTLADTELTWNAYFASMPLDAAESILRESGIEVCWPYYCDENRVPCYRSGTCKNKVCKFTGMKMI